jgi:competence protein ComEC
LGLLWLFALLTGGSASVLRAAVMFSFISIGAQLSRKASIYNSLAASAFVLLCYNPYYLWDVGFQLSYLAVLGIVVFQKPLYGLFFIKNKLLDQCWKLGSVSLAAQVFTFPACIYYFHQFPNLFLLANLLVVPLSGLILYAEIALVALSFIPGLAFVLGKLVSGLLWLMNQVVFTINKLPLAVWDHIHLFFLPALLLYVIVAATAGWLLHKSKMLLYSALSGLCVFTLLQAVEKWTTANRQQVIVYNIPGTLAIDVMAGNRYFFIGDSSAAAPGLNYNFHLKPARIALQLSHKNELAEKLSRNGPFYAIGNKRMLLVDTVISFETPAKKITIDLILLSKNAPVSIAALDSIFDCSEYIFDASNSTWRIGNWMQECKQLNKKCYSIPGRGAYIAGYNR